MNTPLIGFIIVIALIVGSALSIMNKACKSDRDVDLLRGRVQR